MKPTEKVNIGGYSFTLERDAYERLNGYIEDIRTTYSDSTYVAEIQSDIEQRIAELFIEKGGKNGIVDYAMVDSVIQRIGSPAELADEKKLEEQETVMGDEEDRYGQKRNADGQDGTGKTGIRRLYRDIDNRVLGGVCSGLAAYFKIPDPVIPRLIMIAIMIGISLILNAAGRYYNFEGALLTSAFFCFIAYIALWIIIPAAKTVEQKCSMTGQPIGIRQFEEKFEKNRLKNTCKEVSSAPALHTAGRAISVIIGIIMIASGIASLIGCTMYDLIRDVIVSELNHDGLIYGSDDYIIASQFLGRNEFWWTAIGSIVLFAVWLIYNGILLTFNLRSPRWRPGTVIFILWIVSLLVFMILVIRRLLIIGLDFPGGIL